MSAVSRIRDREKAAFEARHGVKLTFLPFVARAVVEALQRHPTLNASWSDAGIVVKRAINLGIAVALEDNLIVPVVRDADRLSITGLATTMADLGARARSNHLKLDEIQGGTFTLNNTGALGAVMTQAIINQPQAAIMTMDLVVKRPVVVGDAIAIRPDHEPGPVVRPSHQRRPPGDPFRDLPSRSSLKVWTPRRPSFSPSWLSSGGTMIEQGAFDAWGLRTPPAWAQRALAQGHHRREPVSRPDPGRVRGAGGRAADASPPGKLLLQAPAHPVLHALAGVAAASSALRRPGVQVPGGFGLPGSAEGDRDLLKVVESFL